MDGDVNDDVLLAAIRKRLLREIEDERRASDAAQIVNNVYGGPMEARGGIHEELAPDDMEYYVDITRKDLPETNPETGKPVGWEKKVRRWRQKAGDDPTDPQKKSL
jgi:hypothetical protein